MPGTILGGTIKYGYPGTTLVIPGANLPLNESAIVTIICRNDYPEAKQLGIAWGIWNPNYQSIETYNAWEAWPYTGGGGSHNFIGGRFPLDVPGRWTMSAYLYTYPDILLDKWEGFELCTVSGGVAESVFSGFLIVDFSKV